MSRTIHLRYDDLSEVVIPKALPRRWREWQRLIALAPQLKAMGWRDEEENPPPYPKTDKAFLALAACFADPSKREALRALVFDLMYDDLKELFIRHAERMHGWKPKPTQSNA